MPEPVRRLHVQPPRGERGGGDAEYLLKLGDGGRVRFGEGGQGGGVRPLRELGDGLHERRQVGRRRGDGGLLVIPRVGGECRHHADRVAGLRGSRASIDCSVMPFRSMPSSCSSPAEHAAARGAVRFAEQEFRRVPAVVLGQVSLDELLDRTCVLIDAPEIAVLVRRDRGRVAGADRVDEHEIAAVEQAVGVVLHRIGRGRREVRQGGLDAPRRERAQHARTPTTSPGRRCRRT